MNYTLALSKKKLYQSCSLGKNSTSYSFTQNISTRINSMNSNATTLLQSYFHGIKNSIPSLLTSIPVYHHTNTKVTIDIFYYVPQQEKSVNLSMINMSMVSAILTNLYQKEVSLVITRIHYPYLSSSIFVQYLAHNSPSNTFVHFQDSILTYPSRNASTLPAYISGIKLEVAGRLVTEPVVPRITTKTSLFGSFSGAPMIDYAKYTTKNELGSFTIKVWIAQRNSTII